jgi:NADH-quinone oxidoreductase subunit N
MTAVSILLPETVLIAAAVAIYLAGAFFETQRPWRWIAGGALALAAALLATPRSGVPGTLPDTVEVALAAARLAEVPLLPDQLAQLGRWLALIFGALLLLTASRPLASSTGFQPVRSGTGFQPVRKQGQNGRATPSGATAEYVGSLLLTLAGLMLVAGAGDLVLLFVGLELISIPTYVLLYLGRHDAARQEAAAKYFFLSVLSSAVFLYGLSFLYGLAGSTDLAAVRDALGGATLSPASFGPISKLALALVFAGLCFRITAVPFQFYAPDVYQGTTYPNAALLSVLPKAAGFLVLARLLTAAWLAAGPQLWQVVLVVSALTMTFGNVTALWQDDLRRLLAYSSIANAGYMLLGLAVALAAGGPSATWDGLQGLWFFLAVYGLATIGAFAALEHLGKISALSPGEGPGVRAIPTDISPLPAGEGAGVRAEHRPGALPLGQGTIDGLAGLGRTRPSVAAVLSICLLSLTGLPPLAGFWGKLLIFGSAVNVVPAVGASASGRAWFIAAAVLGLLNAAVGAAYYLRVVAVMYFREPLAAHGARTAAGPRLAAIACAALVLAIGFYPRPWIAAAGTATGAGASTSRDIRASEKGDLSHFAKRNGR